jgi:hypothetical protein
MGAQTLSSIRAIVRFRGDFPLSTKFSEANVNTEIQAAWSELHELLEPSGYWDKSNTITTVASQAYQALPADCWKVKGVDILEGSDYSQLDQIGIADRNRYGSATDQPRAYRLTERGVDLFPTPNAIYTLRITYARAVTALAESSPTTEMFNSWEEYVIASAIIRLAMREQRQGVQEWMVIRDDTKARILKGAERQLQEPQYLTLYDYAEELL